MTLKLLSFQVLIFTFLTLSAFSSYAQEITDCEKVLDQEPYFVRNKTPEKDQALQRDILILKRCGNFNNIDSAFLKGPILGVLMLEQVNAGKPATYRTIINFFNDFRKTDRYKDFAYSFSLYKKIGQKKVSPADWENDKELFVRMGFTVNDLDDFKLYMSKPENITLTYVAVLAKYMSELEEMRVDKK